MNCVRIPHTGFSRRRSYLSLWLNNIIYTVYCNCWKYNIIPYFLKISPWRDLISRCCTEGGVYRDQHARAYTASIIAYSYAQIMRMRIRRSLSTPYHAARFRGWRLLGWANWTMRQDFKEIRYTCVFFMSHLLLLCSVICGVCVCVCAHVYVWTWLFHNRIVSMHACVSECVYPGCFSLSAGLLM